MSDQYLALWLEGPLQSWGSESLFSRRDTLSFPTLSGVMGIICSSMGRGGEEVELLADFADCFWLATSFEKVSTANHAIPVSRMEDFHMVGSGYDDSDKWQKLSIPKTVDGKPAVGGGAKMTFRYYLENAAFGVVLGIKDRWADEVKKAMASPIWSQFLGRKNCVPSEFIYQGLYASVDAAQEKLRTLAQMKSRIEKISVTSQTDHADEILQIKDVPVQFGKNKIYRSRKVGLVYPVQGS